MARSLREAIVNDVLECCICTETLKHPRTLSCGHNLCLKCLQDDVKVRARNGKYPCPICRQEMQVPRQGVSVIACNIMVKNLVDLMEQHSADDPCATCQNGVPTSVCITCEGKRFCQACVVHHQKHTTSHQVVSLKEFREGKHDDAIRALQSSKCAQHNERYKYYCNDCKTLLCTDCVNLSCCCHTGKSRCQISDAHETAKKSLSQKLHQVDDKLKRLDEHSEQIEENDRISNNTLLEQEQAVKKYYQTLMDKLIENDTQTLRKMHAENQAERRELKMKTQAESDSLKHLRQQLSKTISYGTATETLQLEQPLVNEVQESGIDNEIQSVPEPFVLRYVFTYHECTPGDVKNVSAMLGGVAQCVLEIDTRMSGEENAGNITGLSVLPNRDILAVDHNNQKVKRYNTKGESVGNPLVSEYVLYPHDCVHSPDGSVKVSCAAGVMTFSADGRTQLQAVKTRAAGLALTSKNQFVVTVVNNLTPNVRLYSPSGELVWEVDKDEEGANMFKAPNYVAVNSRDDIIVTDRDLHAVFIIDKHGKLVTKYEYATTGQVAGVCVDNRDFIYVANYGSDEIISLTPDGHFHRVVLSKQDILAPYAVTFDNHGRLCVSCYCLATEKCNTIKIFNITFT